METEIDIESDIEIENGIERKINIYIYFLYIHT